MIGDVSSYGSECHRCESTKRTARRGPTLRCKRVQLRVANPHANSSSGSRFLGASGARRTVISPGSTEANLFRRPELRQNAPVRLWVALSIQSRRSGT